MNNKELVDELVDEAALKTKSIIDAFLRVDRKDFVLASYEEQAYRNYPLPIPKGQTISQPYTVAILTEAAAPRSGDSVLEVGAGSGYQAAILSVVVGGHGTVTAIERIHELFELAKQNLRNYKNVTIVEADGTKGWARSAPYDCIVVSASAPHVPRSLVNQLKDGGRLVIPVGSELFLLEKRKNKIQETFLGYFSFVPLIGEEGHRMI